MIHTMVIRHQINEDTHHSIAVELNLDSSQRRQVTKVHSGIGFREIVLIKEPTNIGVYYGIEILLNPNVMIQGRETIHPIVACDLSRIADEFDLKLRHIFKLKDTWENPSPFNEWLCKRIDYCVDIRTPYVEQYIELFKRCSIISQHFDAVEEDGSHYLNAYSVTVNFYDKHAQLLNREDEEYSSITEDMLAEAHDILRLEIQCKSRKTTHIKDKHEFSDKRIENFLSAEIAREIITSYYNRAVGRGKFYTLDRAIDIISNSSLASRTKGVLIDILKLVSQARSIPSARSQYTQEGGVALKNTTKRLRGTSRTFSKNIGKLRSMGVNPVTIPRRKGIDILDDLSPLIEDAFQNV